MPHHNGALNDDPARQEDAHNNTAATPAERKLVLFADGTGNAFTTQE